MNYNHLSFVDLSDVTLSSFSIEQKKFYIAKRSMLVGAGFILKRPNVICKESRGDNLIKLISLSQMTLVQLSLSFVPKEH
jgi:hypothetical protein